MDESEETNNLTIVAQNLALLRQKPPDQSLLQQMLKGVEAVRAQPPMGFVGGIDSSDNLLLNIPDHPGAAIAGYSYALVVSDEGGKPHYVQERMAEKQAMEKDRKSVV